MVDVLNKSKIGRGYLITLMMAILLPCLIAGEDIRKSELSFCTNKREEYEWIYKCAVENIDCKYVNTTDIVDRNLGDYIVVGYSNSLCGENTIKGVTVVANAKDFNIGDDIWVEGVGIRNVQALSNEVEQNTIYVYGLNDGGEIKREVHLLDC